ncbi:MAG: type II CAAX prenyl endopeptidase Rce1 family protein [SAR324 cluster bacterium]
MSRYFAHSRSAYYGAWCALPLLAAYEALLWIEAPTHGMQVRNAADVWLRLLLESLGLRPAQATLVMMGLVAAAIPVLRRGQIRLDGRYLALMLGEALVYSLALGIVINLVLYGLAYTWLAACAALAAPLALPWEHALAMPGSGELLRGIALSLGAGLFEELAFRVVLLTVLLALLRLVFRPGWAALVAVVLAALIFALAHYGGKLGEPFSFHTLLYRWLAGLLFTLLYYRRGFAITAYAHALYDIWVLLI